MFNKNKHQDPNLQAVIDQLTTSLAHMDVADPNYERTVEHLSRLHKIQNHEKSGNGIDPNTLVTASAHLLGIFTIVGYERMHAMTSKALSFVLKPKLG